jgi:hypothetical protein
LTRDLRHAFIDRLAPVPGEVTFRDYADKSVREHHYTARAQETSESWLRHHVYPMFADMRMCDIRLSTVKEWWAGMRASATRAPGCRTPRPCS